MGYHDVSWRMTAEPVVPPFETWSTQLVMPAQPAPGECRRKYKSTSTSAGSVLLKLASAPSLKVAKFWNRLPTSIPTESYDNSFKR